tara:strand:- start:24783 stop:26384 length:1602 start_codon:yes stop_codon:yes gene_type:complete
MKKLLIILLTHSLLGDAIPNIPMREFVPYYQQNSEIDKKILTEIWKQAMEAKALYKNMNNRNDLIENLASTAPREEFIVNVDISPELELANPEGVVYLSTDGQNSWLQGEAVPLELEGYENTWQSIINNDGSQDVSWYVSAAVDSEPLGFDYGRIIVSQTPYNESNAFPPPIGRYALLAEDEVGDASSNQDIFNLQGTYSDSKAFVSMGINGGCCDEGGFFGPWYLYGVAIVNPEAEDAVAYAIGYGDGGFGQLSPGLYKITGDLQTGEVSDFTLLTGNINYSTSGNYMQAAADLQTIVDDSDWGTWPNSFQGFIALGVTVQAGLDGLDISIELKDQTAPGLMLLTTQSQSDNVDCELSNLIYDWETNTWSVDYIDAINEEGNLPWFKQFQICVDSGPCYYFADMLAIEHNYLEGTTFKHTLPDIITDPSGDIVPDGDYVAKVWFADGEISEYQIAEPIMIINGQIVGDEEPCALQGDVNGDENLNVLDVVLTVNNVLCLDGGDCYEFCADMNQDGILNVLDVVLLVNAVLSD